MRRAIVLLTFAAVSAAARAAVAVPPHEDVRVDLFGQPAQRLEVAGRPLGQTLAIFRSSRAAAPLPAPVGSMRPLAVVAAHLRGSPGALLTGRTRRVSTAVGPIYLVPTVRGWVCVQATTFETCHRGLLQQGVTWSFYSTEDGLDVVGIAADDVRSVALHWARRRRQAALAHNVFFVQRTISLTSGTHIPPLGRLSIDFRGTKAPASVVVR